MRLLLALVLLIPAGVWNPPAEESEMAFRYAGSGWRVAGSVQTFGEQIHQLRGHRISYPVDGTLGDADHSNRTSDHNPDSEGIVRAIDFFEWKPGIVDAVAETLRQARDPRLKYFIHDKRMFSSYISPTGIPAWTWRVYSGVNGHISHGHLSVIADSRAEQTHPWPMPGTTPTPQEDDMSLIARLMVVEAGAKTWLPDQAAIDYWMLRADNITNPEYAAEWRRDFEQMWAREKQNEWLQLRGHPHGAPLKGDKGDKGDPGINAGEGLTEADAERIAKAVVNDAEIVVGP
jgi:hypothetical protein